MNTPARLRSSVRSELVLGPPQRRSRAVTVLRLAALAALLWGLTAGPAAAQAPYQQELLPGFSSFDVGSESSPDLVDLDGDGDLDAIVGAEGGSLRLFANTGSATAAAFVERVGAANPFAGIDVGSQSRPELVDLDGDLDLDAVVGELSGRLMYFENTGTASAPAFVERSGSANPLNLADVGNWSAPALADLDGDGDFDAVVGESFGSLRYFANTGTSAAPAFVERSGTASPVSGIDVGWYGVPDLADLDGDGDLDLVVGERYGSLKYYENTGAPSAAAFVERTGPASPLWGLDAGDRCAPALGDLDGDGDYDAVAGEYYGRLKYLANTGASTAPAFAEQTGAANPFAGAQVGPYSAPDLSDLDGDGNLDAVVGETYGSLKYFANTGVPSAPAFAERTGTANPFAGVDVGVWSTPDLADLDGDGDLDAVVGAGDGALHYFANTGASTAPAYVERTGAASPFTGLSAGFDSRPALGDLDGDRDLDAVVGEGNGTLKYFANTGNSSAPAFAERTGAANPLGGIDVGMNSRPELADLDGDGDLDAVVGEAGGVLRYFANTGALSTPAFAERTGTASPFAGIDVGYDSDPELADLDGDGDFDLVSGDRGGSLVYFRSGWLVADGFEGGALRFWWQSGP